MESNYSRLSDKTIIARTLLIIFLDILATTACFFCGLWLRFDFQFGKIQHDFMGGFFSNMLVWCSITVIVFAIFKLYSSVWIYVGTSEVFRILGAYAVLGIIGVAGVHFYGVALPRSSCIIGFVFSFLCTLAIRFSYRILKTLQISVSQMIHTTGIPNVMVIGAGDAGRVLAEEYLSSETIGEHLSCFIDDNPAMAHRRLCGVPIAGNRKMIPEIVKKYRIDKIVFAIPSASPQTRKNILKICCETGCKVLVLPDSQHMESREVGLHKLRDVAPQDMLGQDLLVTDHGRIAEELAGKTVMVTGAAGVVGSELCRQIAGMNPKKLVIFDICEKDACALRAALQKAYPELQVRVMIGSVQNPVSLKSAFAACHPEILFHAAAHKLPVMMETCPNEAVLNNVFGTWNTARMADQYGVRKFILISGNDAEQKTNILGVCQYFTEQIMCSMERKSETSYCSVRFGSLLDSNGGVIPIFRKQIEQGGPVTVTDPEVTRYFMTVSQAASLILQAAADMEGGETFIFDMGQPVKIDTMARNLVLLSGFKPDEEIKIQYIGLRPGEKLHEDPVQMLKTAKPTAHKRIFVLKPESLEDEQLNHQLEILRSSCEESADYVRASLQKLVPDYQPVSETQKV